MICTYSQYNGISIFPCKEVKDKRCNNGMLENYTETKINIHYSLLVYQILSSMTFCCIRKLSSEIIDIHSCSTICFPELVSGYFLSFSLISCLDIQYKQQLFHNLTRSFVLLRNYDYSFHHS